MTTEHERTTEVEHLDPSTVTPALEMIGDFDVTVCSADACSVPVEPQTLDGSKVSDVVLVRDG